MQITKEVKSTIETHNSLYVLNASTTNQNQGRFQIQISFSDYFDEDKQKQLEHFTQQICIEAWNRLSQLKRQNPILLQMAKENNQFFPIQDNSLLLNSFIDAVELLEQVEMLLAEILNKLKT